MISLLYCGNGTMFQGILLSSLSAAMQASMPLDIHIFTMDMTDKNPAFTPLTPQHAMYIQQKLCSLRAGARVTVHDLRALYCAHLANNPNAAFAPYALLRLLIDQMEGLPPRLIYLDTDTLVLDDLTPLMSWEMCGCGFAATRNRHGKFVIHPRYMHAGVMLLDTARLKESDLLPRARAMCNTRKFPFLNQDVLNRCVGKRCFLPRRYNERYALKADTVICHFPLAVRLAHLSRANPRETRKVHRVYQADRLDAIFACYTQALKEWEQI